jgi:hypothetical protein
MAGDGAFWQAWHGWIRHGRRGLEWQERLVLEWIGTALYDMARQER